MAVTVPNRFFPGTLTDADQVNANFDALTAYINSSLETTTTHNSDLALLPKGKFSSGGYVAVTANQGSITTVVDLTSLTLTPTFLVSRFYRITGFVNFQSTVADDNVTLQITDATPTVIQTANTFTRVANQNISVIAQVVVQPGAGAKQYKLRALRTNGSGTITMTASANAPAFILIEDIGL